MLADYEGALELLASLPSCTQKVLIFTSFDSETMICRALECGAKGYLLFGASLAELFEGIRAVGAGGVALSPVVATRVANRIMGGDPLTAREKSVLQQMTLGLGNKMIAYRLNISIGTVKAHVKSILVKLQARSRTAAVVTAQRRGLLL
jgi:DNA-binding NarL/FixJ family response regulator